MKNDSVSRMVIRLGLDIGLIYFVGHCYLVGLSRKLLFHGQVANMFPESKYHLTYKKTYDGKPLYTMICMRCERTYQSISGIYDLCLVCLKKIRDREKI